MLMSVRAKTHRYGPRSLLGLEVAEAVLLHIDRPVGALGDRHQRMATLEDPGVHHLAYWNVGRGLDRIPQVVRLG